MVTGASPARHGIYSNTTFDPLQKNQGGWYWYATDIRTTTLWDAVGQRGLKSGNVHWPVTVGARIDWNIPQYWRTGTPDDRKLVHALSTPGLLDSLEKTLGPYADGIDESIGGDENRARFVTEMLRTKRPAFMLAYFTAFDHEQHEKGPFTPEAKAVLERIDVIIGNVWQAARDASGGRAVVCLVSDHGFLPLQRSVNLGAAFVEAGLITLGADGKPTKWLAMPWAAGGSAAIVLADSVDRATHGKVRALLDRLASDSANGLGWILDKGQLATNGAFPEAAFVVGFKPGFAAGGAMTGPLITPSGSKGTHGYLNTLPDMRASFFIAGPGIPAGRSLGEIDMRDIAPTLGAILGVRLPRVEGRNLLSTP
jgi:predicted AlkP superfamily pyrophosphatase or phosphodiesterase